jgi:hypothetical protein
LGELLRRIGSRWVGLFRLTDPIERGLVDVYLAGAAFFILAAVPLPLFYPATPAVLLPAGALGLLAWLVWERSGHRGSCNPGVEWSIFRAPWVWLLLGASALLFGIEVVSAAGAATGNTYDSSLYTTYVGLFEGGHTLPQSFQPVASGWIVYPQGTTVWLASAQSLFGLPPARTALLVTPLFLTLAPLAAYVWGRRWLGSIPAGVAVGLVFALVGSWTRVLVSGSNDFVFAFPLILVLWAWIPRCTTLGAGSWRDALGFGFLLGYSAALNPVGAEVTFLVLPLVALLALKSWRARLGLWAANWTTALAVAVALVVPSLAGIVRGSSSATSIVPGGGPGISSGVFSGLVDPFLFRPTDVWLSPFPLLRAELALLLVAGAAILLVLPGQLRYRWEGARAGTAAIAVVLGVALASQLAPISGYAPFSWLGRVTNVSELSVLLFGVYAFVAAVPVASFLELVARERVPVSPAAAADPGPSPTPAGSGRPRPSAAAAWSTPFALALCITLIVPGVVITTTDLPSYESTLYQQFGNVTAGDFDLLSWAGAHLPARSAVLVAPGSAAEFLPGYLPTVTLLYPMGVAVNESAYGTLLIELEQGRLDAQGQNALRGLHVGYIAVTQQNNVLWRPFSPSPLLQQSAMFPLRFHEGDAYVFQVSSA